MNKKGLFISFEGPEAVGKSSQIRSLKFYLKKKRIPHLITREPGGSRISEKIRNLILEKKFNITANEEILLLMAGRIDHINNIIKPALKKGKLVITDRFADSTFVYQGYVNNFGLQNSIKLHRLLLNNFLPSKTFLFFIKPEEIIKRLKKRNKLNKFDKSDISFHKKVITGYKKISKNKKRFILIDANKEFKQIQEFLQLEINKLLSKNG